MKKKFIMLITMCLMSTACAKGNISISSNDTNIDFIYKYSADNAKHKEIYSISEEEKHTESEASFSVVEVKEEKDPIIICEVHDDNVDNSTTDNMTYIEDESGITCNDYVVSIIEQTDAELPFEKELLIKNIICDFNSDIIINIRELYSTDKGASYNEIDELKKVEGYKAEYNEDIKYCMEIQNNEGTMEYYFGNNKMIFIGNANRELY